MAPLQRLASLMVVLLLPALAPLGHAAAAGAGPLPAGVTRHHSVEGITEYRLANGLRVLLFPDASRPTVTVNVTYLVGSRHENYGETGMAHLLEHLLFKDTRAHPDLVRELDRRGMDYNGTTSFDRTTYYESFQASADHLRWALRMEADRMTGARLLAADLASEMTVVRNEFEMGENSPSDVLGKRMQAMAYDWHSYGRSTIGNRSDIENVGLSNLRAFYRTWYQPDNAVLVIAGQFDERAALRTVADSFGTIKRPQRKLPAFWTAEPTQDGERSVTVRRKGDVQMIALAYKIPGALHDDTDGLAYMADILGDTPNGRLHQRLVATGMAAEAYAYAEMNYAPGLLVVGAAVKKGQPLEPVKEALIDLAENFYKVPPTAEEMARIARNTEHGFDSLLADPQRVALALSDAIALGDWRLMFQAREKLAKVTAAQVTATAARYIVRDNRVTGLFLPEDAPRRAEIEVAPGPDVAMQGFVPRAAVASVAAFDPTQDNIDRHTEISRIDGLKLALLPKPTRASLVTVNINLHWGDERNLFGKSVLPGMTSAMLSRGTTRYTRQQLADAFDRLRISGSLNSFTTTREHLAEALRLVAHVMKEPAFPQAEFEQLKQRALVGIEASRNDPQALAARELARLFNPYPKGDVRAAMPLDEQLATVQAVTLEAVKNFYRDFHGASHGEIAIVGDFDALQARAIIVQEFGNWKSRARYARLANASADTAPVRRAIATPDKENGYYTARINLDLNQEDPQYPALVLANFIFGDSGLKSRLLERIRQRDGLSYSGGSSLGAGQIDRAGNFTITAIAAPQNLPRLEAAIQEELARTLRDGYTEQEVADAKSAILQQRAQARADDSGIADGWTRYLFMDRTYAYSKAFEDKLSAVTLQEVNSAFRQAIEPQRLTVVVAGDYVKAEAFARAKDKKEGAGGVAAMMAPSK